MRIILQTPWVIEGIPEVLTLYRVNTEGLSADILKQLASWESVIAKTRGYAPGLVNRWEAMARAYQLRYLARRAVRLKQAKMAIHLVHRALLTHWQIVLSEPRKTLLTLGASYLLGCLPISMYSQIEAFALHRTGTLQQKRIQTDLERNYRAEKGSDPVFASSSI